MMPGNSKHTGSSTRGLRMKELVEATGAPKSTILYYLQQGLLPEPVRTGHNMAYYRPQCITRIRYIQRLQRRHRLSLAEIREILAAGGEDTDLSVFVKLNDIVFGDPSAVRATDEDAFRKATGLSRRQLGSLKRAKLLVPLEGGGFDREDVRVGRVLKRFLELGLSADDLSFYAELGEKIVDHEMALRRRLTHHLPPDQDAVLSMELVENARVMRAAVIERLFQCRVAAMRDLKEKEQG